MSEGAKGARERRKDARTEGRKDAWSDGGREGGREGEQKKDRRKVSPHAQGGRPQATKHLHRPSPPLHRARSCRWLLDLLLPSSEDVR